MENVQHHFLKATPVQPFSRIIADSDCDLTEEWAEAMGHEEDEFTCEGLFDHATTHGGDGDYTFCRLVGLRVTDDHGRVEFISDRAARAALTAAQVLVMETMQAEEINGER